MSDSPSTDARSGNPLRHDWDADAYYRRPHLRLRVLAGLIERLDLQGKRLLDVGCGRAILSRLLGLRRGYVGLDHFQDAPPARGDLDLRPWTWDDDAPAALVDDPPFDVVVASGFLEYVAARAAFFERVREALRPGGVFFTSMINADSLPRRFRAARGLSTRHPCWREIATPSEIDALAREVGLEPVAATPIVDAWNEWPHAAWSLRRRRELRSFAGLAAGGFVDQHVYELRRPHP